MDRFSKAIRFLQQDAEASLKRIEPPARRRLLEALEDARHVVIFGRGRSGMVGRAFAIRLGHLGFRSFFVGETSTPPVSDEDLVLLVSGSGQTFSVVLTAKIARDLEAQVISVTGDPESELAEHSDHVIVLETSTGSQQAEFSPLGTTFEFASHLFFDGLVAELMDRLDEDEQSMLQRHATLE